MPIRTEDFHTSLYDLLKTKGYDPIPLDSTGKTSPFYPEADIFKFTFIKDGKSYGDVWATVDNASKLVLYYDDDVASSPEGDTSGVGVSDSWFGLLKHLKKWAQRRQLGFELKNKDHLVPDMQQREYGKKKERLGEAYYPMGKKASYNDAIPQVKIVIQHSKQLGEGEQRYRNVEKIFVENTEGERFAVPTKKPGLAKIYARHVAEGGTPYDERGKHLTTLIEDYSKMVGFMRATKNGEFTESVQKVVEAGTQHYQSLKETLHRLVGHKGYHNYFDSWTPVLNEEQTDDTVSSLFVQQKIDPRIESCIPILSRIAKLDEVKQVDKLSDWAEEVVSETTGIELPAMMPGAGKNTRTKRVQDREKEEVLAHLKRQQALSHYGKELEKADQTVGEAKPIGGKTSIEGGTFEFGTYRDGFRDGLQGSQSYIGRDMSSEYYRGRGDGAEERKKREKADQTVGEAKPIGGKTSIEGGTFEFGTYEEGFRDGLEGRQSYIGRNMSSEYYQGRGDGAEKRKELEKASYEKAIEPYKHMNIEELKAELKSVQDKLRDFRRDTFLKKKLEDYKKESDLMGEENLLSYYISQKEQGVAEGEEGSLDRLLAHYPEKDESVMESELKELKDILKNAGL